MVLRVFLMAVLLLPATAFAGRNYEHGEKFPKVRYDCSESLSKRVSLSECNDARPSKAAMAAIEEIKELRRANMEARGIMQKSAGAKALDPSTQGMIQGAAEHEQTARSYIEGRRLRSDSDVFKMLDLVRREYGEAQRLWKTGAPRVAMAEYRNAEPAAAAQTRGEGEVPDDVRKRWGLAAVPDAGKKRLSNQETVAAPVGPSSGASREGTGGTIATVASARGSRYLKDLGGSNLEALRENAEQEPSASAVSGAALPSLTPLARPDDEGAEEDVQKVAVEGRGPAVLATDQARWDAETDEKAKEEKFGGETGKGEKLVDEAWDRVMAGDFAAAEEAAREALKLDPDNAAALEVLALAQLRQGKYREAIASASAAIKLDPKRADAWAFRAFAKEALGDFEGSLSDIAAAAELDARYEERFRLAKAGGRMYDPSQFAPGRKGLAKKLVLSLLALLLALLMAWLIVQSRKKKAEAADTVIEARSAPAAPAAAQPIVKATAPAPSIPASLPPASAGGPPASLA